MHYIILLLTIVGLDQVTKFWVVNSFRLYESREIIPGVFNLLYARNTGVAFSMFAHYDSPWRHYFFIGVNIAAVLGLTFANFRMQKGQSGILCPLPSLPVEPPAMSLTGCGSVRWLISSMSMSGRITGQPLTWLIRQFVWGWFFFLLSITSKRKGNLCKIRRNT